PGLSAATVRPAAAATAHQRGRVETIGRQRRPAPANGKRGAADVARATGSAIVRARYVGPGTPTHPAARTATVPASQTDSTTVSAGGRRSRPAATHRPTATSGPVTHGLTSESS